MGFLSLLGNLILGWQQLVHSNLSFLCECELLHLTKERTEGAAWILISLVHYFIYIPTQLSCKLMINTRRNHSNSLFYSCISLGCGFYCLDNADPPKFCFPFLFPLPASSSAGRRGCSRSCVVNGIRKITWIKITRRERVENMGYYMDSFFPCSLGYCISV